MIPYTVDRRPDTGVSNVTLGIWLFLASEVMLFGALFSSYALLRVSAVDWPSGRDVLSTPLGALNTAVLLLMTALVWRARASAAPARLLAAASGMALLFLAVKGFEYRAEISAGLLPSVSTFLAMYFTLTGLHALHVACGLAANLWVIAGTRHEGGRVLMVGRAHALALYWLFVDLVWLVIFPLMYLT